MDDQTREASEPKPMGFWELFQSLWPYIKPYRALSAVLLAGLLLETGMEALMRVSVKLLIDEAITPRNHSLLVVILGVMGVGAIITSAASFGCDYLWAHFGSQVMNRMRSDIFTHLQKLSIAFYARSQIGDLMTRFSSDLDSVQTGLLSGLPSGIISIGGLFLSAGLLFQLEWRLALLTVIGIPICFLAPRFLGDKAIRAELEKKRVEAVLAGIVQETISAQPVVKAFGLQSRMVSNFESKLDGMYKANMRSRLLSFLLERLSTASAMLMSLLVIGVGAVFCFQGSLSVGSLAAFQVLLVGMNGYVFNLTWVIPFMINAAGGMSRIRQILDEIPQIGDTPAPVQAPLLEKGIEFNHLYFRYPGSQSGLEDIHAVLPAHSRIAFVGGSGSGKSTLMSVLMRFYDPNQGQVLFDGTDARTIAQDSLRSGMAAVFQESFLFNISIRENIRLGNPVATDAEIEYSARLAEIHDHIMSLPKGYDTLAGERGSMFSGGQRQRIAIARALVRNPCLLLLDEATSALDPATEHALNETLERVSEGRTVVSVTHRLGTVVNADKILVFEKGRLVEQGKHKELVSWNGPYAHLWKKQNVMEVSTSGGESQVDLDWLGNLPFFKGIKPDIIADISELLVTETFQENRVVIYEGDPGDRFFIIVRGRVLVTKANNKGIKDRPVILIDGDYFGEIALLKNVPRSATVKTLSNSLFLTLRQEKFLDLMKDLPELRAVLEKGYLWKTFEVPAESDPVAFVASTPPEAPGLQ